jgi:2,5-dihydroxypyridine 5,6-dioxygenase
LVGNPPPEDKANGRLVLNVGDVMFPFGFYCREPVTLDVDGGRIARVGGGLEAKLFQQYLDWAGDKGARVISHVGWGCDPRANWNALNHVVKDGSVGVEIRSAYGCLLIAFGANADLGGKTHTKSHFDLVARGVSYAVDGTTILDRGQFVPKELR